MSTVKKSFSIAFGDGICGLEILFDPVHKEFVVGNNYYSPTAKKFKDVLPGARILSLNGQPTSKLSSMEEIQNMFKEAANTNKVVVFDAKLKEEQRNKMLQYSKEQNFEVLDDSGENQNADSNEYTVTLPRRPLGFTIAAAKRDHVVVVQVDSVHEEDLKLGSPLLGVNGEAIKNEAHAIQKLLTCKMPCQLKLGIPSDNLFEEKEEESLMIPIHLAHSIGDAKDQFDMVIEYSGSAKDKYDPFTMPIRVQATVGEARAKIAACALLKYSAVNMIAKGKLMKDDTTTLSSLGFKAQIPDQKTLVVVSETEQNKSVEPPEDDYVTNMQIIGAYLKTADKDLLNYLWVDIDHEKKDLLHITELDRLLARYMGVYEHANHIKPKVEWKHGSVKFDTRNNLGLVIEGNEVIMCHPGSQAEKEGILPGWKVVGADYVDKKGKNIKFPVDHKSCLQSLKRAKTECANNGFSVICLIPTGNRYKTQIEMKNHAIKKLDLDNGSQTLTRTHFDRLPSIFANKAVRVSYNVVGDALEFIKASGSKKDHGAVVRTDAADPDKYMDDITRAAGVKQGWRVLAIGNEEMWTKNFKEVLEAKQKCKHPFAPPFHITYAPPL